jgi:alkylation response protein AidB-like acyl-CoA dehydrogenase
MATAAKLVHPADDFTTFGDATRFIAKVKELAPLFAANAAEGEKLRAPTPAVDKALRDNGLMTLLLPKRLGGAGLSFTDYSKVQIEAAKGDPSISWVMQILNGCTWVASLASDALQDELFKSGAVPICSAYNPPGKAKKIDGGWIINGAWPYSSGSRQAEWIQAGVVLEGYDGPVVPGIYMVYIPMSQIEIKNTWFMTGMQGTGSDTSIAKDIFVPDHMMVMMDKPYGHVEDGKRNIGAPSDNLTVVPVVRTTGIAQLIGMAEAMQAIIEAEMTTKPVLTTFYAKRVDSGAHVHEIGRIAAQIDAAKVILFNALATLDDVALTGREFTLAERARNKAACGQVIELVHKSVEDIMFVAGSSAFALDKPISRYWRDCHVAMRHVQNIPMLGYEIYGRDRLGVANISPPGAY